MARVNVELKARDADPAATEARLRDLGAAPADTFDQRDIYFRTRSGRLKLRTSSSSELIAYRRPDDAEPAESTYVLAAVSEPDALAEALEATKGMRLRDEVAVVPVLRAGLGMVEGFLRLLPDARVGHVGIYRDEEEHVPIDYFERLPPRLPAAQVYVLDPMLATGGSAVHALHHLKRAGAKRLEHRSYDKWLDRPGADQAVPNTRSPASPNPGRM